MNDITLITRDNLYKIIDEMAAYAAQVRRRHSTATLTEQARAHTTAKLIAQNCAYTDSFLGNPI